MNAQTLPNEITVTFSRGVNQSSVTPNDLVLSGTGINASNPAHAVGLNWIDSDTVEFFLSGSSTAPGP